MAWLRTEVQDRSEPRRWLELKSSENSAMQQLRMFLRYLNKWHLNQTARATRTLLELKAEMKLQIALRSMSKTYYWEASVQRLIVLSSNSVGFQNSAKWRTEPESWHMASLRKCAKISEYFFCRRPPSVFFSLKSCLTKTVYASSLTRARIVFSTLLSPKPTGKPMDAW